VHKIAKEKFKLDDILYKPIQRFSMLNYLPKNKISHPIYSPIFLFFNFLNFFLFFPFFSHPTFLQTAPIRNDAKTNSKRNSGNPQRLQIPSLSNPALLRHKHPQRPTDGFPTPSLQPKKTTGTFPLCAHSAK
jgi:hypothetical protein